MNADSDLTELIIGAAYAVHNELKSGFLEVVYRRALAIELTHRSLSAVVEAPLAVFYKGTNVGDYRADLLVESRIVVEVKAVDSLVPMHEQQLLHYLYATGKSIGLLINFGRSVSVKRKIVSSNLRQSV
ncbi:MAG: GxxExxY protein [Betaproteobacteria bacterium]|nr:MAG: GxxExxY protein [Betaproteobacteria bacterium]TAG49275.1 MAG: GxxExxY protein [Betaproteobacteria bacterium]